MVTPERRRRAVAVLVERFGVSERRACGLTGQHRSTQRRPPRPRPEAEDKLRARLRQIARDHPLSGNQATQWARMQVELLNRKRWRTHLQLAKRYL